MPLETICLKGVAHYTVYYTESAKSGLRFIWASYPYMQNGQYWQRYLKLIG